MSERFIKFIPSEEAMWLLKKKGHAFRLLAIIAEAARRYEGGPDGLKIGECFIGGHENYDMTERNYRTAKDILVARRHVEIVETCRTRKKSTTGTTTVGTKVKLLSTNVWDINSKETDDRSDDWPTTDRRPTDDKQRKKKNDKKEKKSHPSIPSNEGKLMTDDFSFEREKEEERASVEVIPGIFLSQEEIEECVKIKGSLEKVQRAMKFIQESKKRKHAIGDWPKALASWKIEDEARSRVKSNVDYTEKLCQEFQEFDAVSGWRCYMYTDKKKDQRGVLFESQSAYQEAFFVALADGELREKCEEFIQRKNMRRKN